MRGGGLGACVRGILQREQEEEGAQKREILTANGMKEKWMRQLERIREGKEGMIKDECGMAMIGNAADAISPLVRNQHE